MRYLTKIFLIVAAVLSTGMPASARDLNDRLQNKPYADLRSWHLGFGVGMHVQDLLFTHNGFTTPEGESWFMEQPDFSPGFNLCGILDKRLNQWFNLRVSPGMFFGNRMVKMRESAGGETLSQNIKTAYVAVPLELKYSAMRYRNARPYIIGGVMPTFNVTKMRHEYLKLNTADCFLTVGLGCDSYLPYFKLIPELKFCFGLTDVIDRKRPDLTDEPDRLKITQSLKKATSSMVVLTFYFE